MRKSKIEGVITPPKGVRDVGYFGIFFRAIYPLPKINSGTGQDLRVTLERGRRLFFEKNERGADFFY